MNTDTDAVPVTTTSNEQQSNRSRELTIKNMVSVCLSVLFFCALICHVTAKNNYFLLTYFAPGSNCTVASGKPQEKFTMNVCNDHQETYTDVAMWSGASVAKQVFSDYQCKVWKSTTSYPLNACKNLDSKNDMYPTAF
jgi:hypothetical protein